MHLGGYVDHTQMTSRPLKLVRATHPFLFQSGFVLHELPEKDMALLQHHSKTESKKRGTVLFRQGGFPTGVYWLTSGKIKICSTTKGGQRQTLYIYSDGDLIAHRQMIAGEKHPVSAVLLEDSTFRFIPAELFRSLLSNAPMFQRNMLTALAKEFAVWTNRLTVFQNFPVKQRLLLALLVLNEQYSLSGMPEGQITITRTELSEYVGASLETIVRVLNQLKSNGLVQIQGRRITLSDPLSLVTLLEKEDT